MTTLEITPEMFARFAKLNTEQAGLRDTLNNCAQKSS